MLTGDFVNVHRLSFFYIGTYHNLELECNQVTALSKLIIYTHNFRTRSFEIN